MQEAYEHIKGQITLVKQAFDVSEDFKQAVKLLRLLVSRPMDWQVVSQQQYEYILNQMDYQFRVSNVFGSGKTLAGRAEIEAEALRRDRQYDIWRAWEKTYEVKMIEAQQSVQVVNAYELGAANIPIRYQRVDWEKVLLGAQSALDALANPPDRLREDIFSRKTMEIFDNSKVKIGLAEEWKYSAERYLVYLPLNIEKVVSEARRLLITDMKESDKVLLITKLEDTIKQYGKTVKLLCVLSEAYAKAGNIENANRLKWEAIRIQAVNDAAEMQEIERTSERVQVEQIAKAYELLGNNEFEAADRMFRLVVSDEKDIEKREALMYRFENVFKKINRSLVFRIPKFFSTNLR
jgi:hypothetical protein